MSSTVISDDELWRGLNSHVTARYGGPVGIAKMLRVPSSELARAKWVGWVRPILVALASRLPISLDDAAVVRAGDGVSIQLDIGVAFVEVNSTRRWYTFVTAEVAALVLVGVGQQRWGREWEDVILSRPCDRQIIANTTSEFPDVFPWLAPNLGSFGRYILADSERSAELAVRAEEFGWEWVAGLFDEFEGGGRG